MLTENVSKFPGIHGVPDEVKPFRCDLAGRVRMRFRQDDFADVFIRTPTGLRAFLLVDAGDHFTIDPDFEFARNHRA